MIAGNGYGNKEDDPNGRRRQDESGDGAAAFEGRI